ncbi:DWNN-domain-containing protein [Auricularia subglabra TFB-10046 SS5]|nr:DWNN-domain-containing protein [Auricularia subglabra TFB-10046 SS5]
MASWVLYQFRSQKDWSRIHFDGDGISVFDLRRRILLANKIENVHSLRLAVYDEHDEEYTNDTTVVPCSSSVIVRRLPASEHSRVPVSHDLAGMPIPSSRSTRSGRTAGIKKPPPPMQLGRQEHLSVSGSHTLICPEPNPAISITSDEAAGIASMFSDTELHWKETQERMSRYVGLINRHLRPLGSRSGRRSTAHDTSAACSSRLQRPPPLNYVCFRCGVKGCHWIQNCPTNGDAEFDVRPRVKPSTGIPRTFLKAVDRPRDGSTVMMSPAGSYVIAQPDTVSWTRQKMHMNALTDAASSSGLSMDASLVCSLCSHLLNQAVKTPCCCGVYCEDCIQSQLVEYDFKCPSCNSEITSFDKLLPANDLRAQVQLQLKTALPEGTGESSAGNAHGTSSNMPAEPSKVLVWLRHDLPKQDCQPARTQIQAKIDEMQAVLSLSWLSQTQRTHLETQLQQLSSFLQRHNTTATPIGATGSGAKPEIAPVTMGGMTPDYCQNYPRWMNYFANCQPTGPESAYERLPVSTHRRGARSDRAFDALEVTGRGPASETARSME